MHLSSILSRCALPLAAILLAGNALAQPAAVQPPPWGPAPHEVRQLETETTTTKLGVRYVGRPLTLPAGTLSPELGGTVLQVDLGGEGSGATIVGGTVGAKIGILDDFEAEVHPFKSIFSPEFHYGGGVGLTARFLDREAVELGARLRAFVSEGIGDARLDERFGVVVTPAIPIRIHARDIVRVDTGVQASFSSKSAQAPGLYTFDPSSLNYGPGVPVDISFQLDDPFWIGVNTGLGIASFEDVEESIFLPAGLAMGGTFSAKKKPVIDLDAAVTFPYFVNTSFPSLLTIQIWSATVDARVYLPL